MTPSERILQFIDYKGYGEERKGKSLRTFYNLIGLPTGSFKKERSIGSDNLMKVFIKFPELNMDWIITGRGEMLYKEPENVADWKEKYYQLLDMKITVVTPEKEEQKKAADVVVIGYRDELKTMAAEDEHEYLTTKNKTNEQ